MFFLWDVILDAKQLTSNNIIEVNKNIHHIKILLH